MKIELTDLLPQSIEAKKIQPIHSQNNIPRKIIKLYTIHPHNSIGQRYRTTSKDSCIHNRVTHLGCNQKWLFKISGGKLKFLATSGVTNDKVGPRSSKV